MHSEIIQETLVLLALAVAAVVLFRRLNQPAILGYLFIGILAGPYALGWIQADEITTLLGEIGVVFLLFTIGLEFSIPDFIRMRYALFGLGGLQVLLGTISGMAIAMSIGINWQAGLIIGGALSLSSTAVVIKQLSDQVELRQEHGRVAVSILLFQDIAAIPFLVMIPILAQEGSQHISLLLLEAIAKGVFALLLLLALGRWILRPLLHEVAGAKSDELFTLTVLFIALAAAGVTNMMGLSLALGAFIAAMMLGETQYRHQIEAEIRPFRDILLGLFFITVGIQLNVMEIIRIWPWVLLLVCGLVIGKGGLVSILARFAGYSANTSLRTGIVLGQGGEFGIALMALSLSTGLINNNELQPILAAIIISMGIAPLLIRYSGQLLSHFKLSKQDDTDEYRVIDLTTKNLQDHIILCGYGRTGQHIKRILKEQNIFVVGLDINSKLVESKWQENELIFYGNAADIKLLEALGLPQAAAVLITFDDIHHSKSIISSLRSAAYDTPIIARAHDQEDLELLMEAGATEVVPEDLETSLMMLTLLFLNTGMPLDDVIRHLDEIKKDQYRSLNET